MVEWQAMGLSDFANIVTGRTPRQSEPDSWGDEIDFITPSDQRYGSRFPSVERKLSALGGARLSGSIVPSGSTNLTCIGSTIGKVSMSPSRAVTNQQINTLVAKKGIVDQAFLYYMILNWSPTLRSHASGSATPIINKKTLANFRFLIPSIEEQQAIAEVLDALDSKIAANAGVVRTIESLSRSIYASGVAEYQMEPLSGVADFVNGKAFTKGASGTGRVVIRIAELNSGLGGSTIYSDAEVEDKHVVIPGDILFAWSGSLTLNRWYRGSAIVNQHIFKVIPSEGYPAWLVYELIRSKLADFKSTAADKATTMGHIQRHHLDELVAVPTPERIMSMDVLMSQLWQRGLAAEQESLTLATLRDTLLPELMSGRLRVKDAEKKIEEVV